MKKIFSFLLISAGLMIGTQAKADFAADWANAVVNGGTIVLNDDVEVEADLTPLNGPTVVIDLNGNDLDLQTYLLQVKKGSLTITGEGNVLMSGSANSRYRQFLVSGSASDEAGYTTVTIDENVTVNHTAGYGISVMQASGTQASYGVTLNIKGTVIGFYAGIQMIGNIQKTSGNVPVVNIESTAKVLNITPDNDGAGIYAAGYAIWNIKGQVSGVTGIYAKSGVFNIEGANISATGSRVEPSATKSGFNGAGDAITFDTMNGYTGKMVLNISGNSSISSVDGYAIYEIITGGVSNSELIAIDIESGEFNGAEGGIKTTDDVKSKLAGENPDFQIKGGTFNNDDLADYLNLNNVETVEVDGKKLVVTKAAQLTERDVVAGNFGTICYEFDCANFAGAMFFQIAEASADGLQLEEVAKLEAGKPYIFLATASKIVLEQGQEVAAQPETVNHLVGSFEEAPIAEGTYIILNNKMTPCGTGCKVGAHRAYIDLGVVGAPVQARRVGGRTISMGADAVTAMGEVRPAKSDVMKMMQHGRLVINHKGIKYSADGKRFK